LIRQQIKAEILIPIYYNDKTSVEDEKLTATYDDIEARFGGCTLDETPLIGGWIDPDTKIHYEDQNITYWVLCDGTDGNIEFFRNLKDTLKKRFKQQEILMYYLYVYRL